MLSSNPAATQFGVPTPTPAERLPLEVPFALVAASFHPSARNCACRSRICSTPAWCSWHRSATGTSLPLLQQCLIAALSCGAPEELKVQIDTVPSSVFATLLRPLPLLRRALAPLELLPHVGEASSTLVAELPPICTASSLSCVGRCTSTCGSRGNDSWGSYAKRWRCLRFAVPQGHDLLGGRRPLTKP